MSKSVRVDWALEGQAKALYDGYIFLGIAPELALEMVAAQLPENEMYDLDTDVESRGSKCRTR